MSAILKGRWTQQPQYPVGVDPAHWAARGLKFVLNGTSHYEHIRQRFTTVNGTISRGVLGHAQALDFSGASNFLDGGGIYHSTTGQISVLVVGSSNVTSRGDFMSILGTAYNQNQFTLLSGLSAASTPEFYVSNSTSANYSSGLSSILLTTGRSTVLAGTAKTNNIRVFVDGKLGAANTGASSVGTPTAGILRVGTAETSSTGNLDGKIALALIWDWAIPDDGIAELSRNPWQIFAPTVKRIYFTAPGGGVTASLTGVSSTTAVGALSTSAGVSQSLTGVSSSTGIGSLVLGAGASSTLSGVASVTAVGSLSNSAGVGITLTGVASTTAVGTLVADASGAVSVALTGLASTTAVGVLSTSAGVNVTLSGRSSTSGVGSLSTSIGYGVVLSGVSATASVGSLSTVSNVNQTINGVSATCLVGSLVASVSGVVPNASRRRITLINRVDRSSLVRRVSRKTII